jgi:2-polyprenyl-3-methyl-5-hydroxy-6-metoxy-1,4-benzoquinol methylase
MKRPHSESSIEIEEQRRFWNSWNARYREGNIKLPEWSLRQARIVIEWIKGLGKTDLHILEIGCGSGWLCQQLVAFGRVTGTDLSNEVLARSEADLKKVSFVAGDFFALDFPSSSFDVIVSLEVLAHVGDQDAFFARIALLLRPGGYLMLSTQNRFVLERWTQVPLKGAGQLRKWVDVKTLRGLVSNHFEIAELTSIVPVGDLGILRWINAPKVNRLLSVFASRPRMEALKERLFLGHTLMLLARKPTRQAPS